MTIDQLKIGQPVKAKKNPTNAWRLYVSVMHGDADHYDTTKTHFKKVKKNDYDFGEEELLIVISILQKILKNHYDRREFESIIKEFDPKYKDGYDDIMCDIIPSDCTTDFQYRTSLRSFKVTWFDENGIEHEVSITEEKKDN